MVQVLIWEWILFGWNFKLWYDLNDSYSSSVLSGILMLFVFLIMYVDYYYKNKHHYSFNQI